MAPGQARFGVLGGSKEEAKVDIGENKYFLAYDNDEFESMMKTGLTDFLGPEPGETVSNAGNGAGKRIISPHVGPESGATMLGLVHGIFPTW